MCSNLVGVRVFVAPCAYVRVFTMVLPCGARWLLPRYYIYILLARSFLSDISDGL